MITGGIIYRVLPGKQQEFEDKFASLRSAPLRLAGRLRVWSAATAPNDTPAVSSQARTAPSETAQWLIQ